MKRTKTTWRCRRALMLGALALAPALSRAQRHHDAPGGAPAAARTILLFPATLNTPDSGNSPGAGTPAPAPGGASGPAGPEGAAPAAGGAAPSAPSPSGAAAPSTRRSVSPLRKTGSTGAAASSAAAPPVTPLSTAKRQTEEIVTDALRKYLIASGVSVIVYDKRLPSIQRAVAEGTLRPSDVDLNAEAPERAQRLADIAGAAEYITATVDDYKYDSKTRAASLNLVVSYRTTEDGSSLGGAVVPGKGVAPVDVAGPRQEGSAVARAAEAAAEQAAQGLFPHAASKPTPKKRVRSSKEKWLLPTTGVVLGLIALKK